MRKIFSTITLMLLVLMGAKASFAATATSPAGPMNFPATLVGSTATQNFTVTITGFGEKVVGVDLSDNVNYTLINNQCPGKTTSDGSCTFTVQFNPTIVGAIPAANVVVTSIFDRDQVNLTGTGLANPVAALNPNAFDFGQIGVGQTSAPIDFNLTNTGTTDLTVTSAAISGNSDFTILNDACSGVVVGVDQDCLVQVVYSPFLLGAATPSGSLDFVTDGGNVSAALDGEGITGPLADVTPAGPLDFGQVGLGNTSSSQILQLTNRGTDELTGISVALTGADAGSFAITSNTCPATLAPGTDCVVEIAFTPLALGAIADAQITFTTDTNSPVVDLDGEGIDGPNAVANPTALDFGQIGQGQSSGMLAVLLSNNGSDDLTIDSNPAISGTDSDQFDIQNAANACIAGTVLSPGESCVVQVVYSPDEVAVHSASLDFDTDTNDVSVDLDGEGVTGPVLLANPTSLDFGTQQIGVPGFPQLVQVTNVGTDTLNISAVSFGTSEYDLLSDTCSGQALGVNASCVLLVVFQPTAVGNPVNDTLTIASDATSGDNTVDLTGVAVQSDVSLTGSGAFGNVTVGESAGPNQFTVTNTGSGDLTIGTVIQTGANTDQFSITNDECSNQVLAPAEQCTFEATFNPTSAGSFSSVITVPNSSLTGPLTVNLSGTGIVPGVGLLQIKTNVIDFDLEVGGTSSQSTTVTNVGDAPVTINSLVLEGDSNFAQTNDCDGATLNAGDTCTITATFTAGNAAGNFNATVSIDSNPASLDFLVLIGSAILDNDTPDSGGCSLSAAAGMSGSMLLWLGLPISGLFLARFRRRG